MSWIPPRSRAPRWLGAVLLLAGLAPTATAAEIKLARHPDYHNGKIVFSYLGDLWLVNDDGSSPRRLTVNRARDVHPRFSPDGKWIAFSSDRYGNNDVFVIPATGGPAKRLTYHSAPDTVVGWTRDSKRVLFTSARGLLYPGIPNLYEVPLDGGVEQSVRTDWGSWGSYSPDGKRLAFNRHPMVWWRKHYRGSYSADLWVYDSEKKSYTRILDDKLPDDQKPNNLWPMYANGTIYFVSDRETMGKAGSPEVMKSTNNLWKISEYGGEPTQVTHHKSGNLFFPSVSGDGKVIVYEQDFVIWKLDVPTGKTQSVKIDIASDDTDNNVETKVVNGEADTFHLSPSGKRAVISTQGELFTIATEKGEIRRLTQTPGVRESQPRWSPDGKWIAFVADTDGSEQVWLCDESGGNMKQISRGESQRGQIRWAPDSKALLYTASDRKLYRYDLDGGKTTVLTQSEVVGFGQNAIQSPEWSPDGKWISYTRGGRNLLPHVYIIPSEGGKEHRITDDDTYSDSSALWAGDGKQILYLAGSDVGNIGGGGRSSAQMFAVHLAPQEKDDSDKSIDSEEQATQAERKGTPKGKKGGGEAKAVEVKIDFDGLARRSRQLTRSGDAINGMVLSPDGKMVAFATTGVEGGRPVQSLWALQLDSEQQTRIAQGAGGGGMGGGRGGGGFGGGFSGLQFAKDGRTVFYKQGGGIYSVAVGGGGAAATPATPTTTGGGRGGRGGAAPAAAPAAGGGRRVNFVARVEIDHRAQRKQVFEEGWRVMKHRFYAADMHGVDWEKVKKTYAPLLEFAGNREDMHDLVSLMLGELNASHTGISGGAGGRGEANADQTRFPGFELQPDNGSGYYKVTHVYKHGPADKDLVKIKPGDYILAVDGQPLKAGDNYWKAYTQSPGTKIEFTVNAKPRAEGAWTTRVAPVNAAQHGTLQYEKWVDDRKALVDKLSNGTVGYLHIRQMNEPSLRKFERDLATLSTKKALVIDQRFNPGGSIDQELLQILQQKQYQYTKLRDSIQVTRPLRGFFGPMVVMQNERSTSDAEVFPDGFRTLKLGKVVGVTTYGAVIGTGAYTLMDGSSIRVPGSGLWNVGGVNLENYGVPPDVYVDNTPEDFFRGRDAQLERAVEVLQQQLNGQK
jgi:tricorn protease